MKMYSVDAKSSKEQYGNKILFYKENEIIWISFSDAEERGFTIYETKQIIEKLKKCVEEK